ncbi:MAG: hypothetical protein GWM98_05435 [Nitrospinaceae bacterium]|nr:hypothetical protein [Nitrospinaceae bacterium]NIR54011.1 hypothetical protein [Nitrospinaceae bacterium]NIS84430.1 hypothetical protein [Nitrospinaceae bacterium]NIT81221.1 hypothetical protein [Nitrospinaceae bacterium]NIU43510.1 hypothetical protein [Nitrospinaceae bacterium]
MPLANAVLKKLSGLRFGLKWGLAGWVAVVFSAPFNIFGEQMIRTISLEEAEVPLAYRVPMGSNVIIKNNHPGQVYRASIVKADSEVKLVEVESLPSGESFALQFSQRGVYSFCYSMKPTPDSTGVICLEISVVQLQAA